MRLPYPTVAQKEPFLYFTVEKINLQTLANNVGTTQLMVYRAQKRGGAQVNYGINPPTTPIYYTPLEQSKNQRFTFVMDSQLFTQKEGRYVAILQYNGVWIAQMGFIYANPNPQLVPDDPNAV